MLRSSDAGLSLLILLLLLGAGVCRIFMGRASPVPDDKRIVTICRGGFKRDREEMKELQAAFAKDRPDIYVKVIQSSLERKPDTMLAAGVPPDVMFVPVDKIDYYVESGALLDLGPYIEADPELSRLLFGDPDGEKPDFYPQTVSPFIREVDGKRHIYALPVNYVAFMMFYNKDLFDKYRVDYPDENWDWDGLRRRALALTRDKRGLRPDQPGFDTKHVQTFGFDYAFWQHPVATFIRQAGGRIVSEDGTRVVTDNPGTIEALQYLYDLKRSDGVIPPYNPSGAREERANSFQKGNVAMYLGGCFTIPTLRDQAPNMDWDVAPLPRGPGGRRGSVVFTNGYGIATLSKDPEATFAYLRFLVSDEGMSIQGRNSVFFPCRRSIMEKTVKADRARKPYNKWALTHDVDYGYANAPFATKQDYFQVYECVNEHFSKLLQSPSPPYQPEEAAHALANEGNTILQRDRTVKGSSSFGLFVVLLGGAPAAYILYRLFRRKQKTLPRFMLLEERWGYVLISPWMIGFLIFMAFPILVSIGLSFSQWQSLSDFTQSEFIGFENYRVALSGTDPKFWTSMWVTFRYALVAVPAGLVAGLAMAVLMNQAVKGIAIFRTVYYLPAVLPSVAAAVLWWYLFDANNGWVNAIIDALDVGGWFSGLCAWIGLTYPIGWLQDQHVTPWVFIIMSLWVVGGGMIIYLAGLQGIPTALYEAADIDGAGRWSKFRHVTIPMLSPVILFNLIMGIIASFQVFNIAFVLFDGQTGPRDSALFYGLHLFREAFFKYRLGYASALAWILFTIILIFTAIVFKSSPLWVHYEAQRRKRA